MRARAGLLRVALPRGRRQTAFGTLCAAGSIAIVTLAIPRAEPDLAALGYLAGVVLAMLAGRLLIGLLAAAASIPLLDLFYAGPPSQELTAIGILVGVTVAFSIVLARSRRARETAEATVAELRCAEAELRASEERRRLALEAAELGSWEWDIGSGRLAWSEGLERIFGVPPGGFAGTAEDWIARAHADDREELLSAVRGLHSGDRLDLTYRIVRPDGSARRVEDRGRVVRDAQGRPERIYGVVSDVTAREKVEQELERGRELCRLVVEASNDMISLIDPDGTIRFASSGHRTVFGYEPEELVGTNMAGYFHPDDLPAGQAALGEIFAGAGRGFTSIARIRHRSGSWIYVEGAVTPIRSEQGRVTSILVISRDVTERRRAEEELARSERLLRAIFDGGPECVALVACDGTILMMNPAGVAMVEADSVEQVAGRPWRDCVAEGSRERVDELIEAGLAARSGRLELELAGMKGARRWLEASVAPLRDEHGEIVMLVAVARDVTGRRALEAQLRQAQKMEAVGKLAGGIAHDFNNLLTAISGYAALALARAGDRDPELRASIGEIESASRRAAALTQQLLAFSRRQMLQLATIDLNAVVSRAERLFSRLIGEDVLVVASLAAGRCPVTVDAGQLEQVLLNLVLNARDAMPEGGTLTIATERVELDEAAGRRLFGARPGGYALLSVTDTGQGMDAETQARAFEPFFTSKPVGAGTGLGLSTAYGIVKQSGGYITVESEPGRGTVARVYLPLSDAEPEAEASPEDDGAPRGHETILVVEDEDVVRTLVCQMLEGQGYRVVGAADPEQALTLLAASPRCDLVLTDIVMPKMNGRELARRLASARPELKVLYTSGYTGEGFAERGTPFLPKPFSPGELARKVREVLDERVAV